MTRNKIIIILVVIALVLAAVSYFLFSKKEKTEFDGETFVAKEGEATQTLSLSGRVSSVDLEDSFLIMRTVDQKEIKIIISQETRLIKLEAPFSPDDPPTPGTQFVPESKEINLPDFQEGDEVLVISKDDVNGKSEIDNVDLVQILP